MTVRFVVKEDPDEGFFTVWDTKHSMHLVDTYMHAEVAQMDADEFNSGQRDPVNTVWLKDETCVYGCA
ncbi:MAG: hypothetical protein E6R03_14230 [Hyphomicrobiaceae bacterium]|nr:MAG: hypothetical protein E6R03_14230 [Hyphomicrobiaceae bacterium]